MAENRYTKAAKATIEKHAPKLSVVQQGEDPRVQVSTAPGDAIRLGEKVGVNIPSLEGHTLKRIGPREATFLDPSGEEHTMTMGQHMDSPSKPAAEEWGGHQAIEDLIYPGGAPEGRPIDSSELRSILDEEGFFDSFDPEEALLDPPTERTFEIIRGPEELGLSADEAKKIDDQRQREELDIQIEDANFPDPRTADAVRGAVDDMLAEQFVGLKLLSTSAEHQDGVPDNIYFEAEDGSRWEWNSNGEIHRAD
tara:strand:+ start:3181 stop:3936 length:756 start_codon:yes stop_codon:yes gene_type:complete